MKIGAMALHPKQGIVASGEVNVYPDIHIWNAQTLETLAILQTSHRGGILHIAFSPNGEYVVSIAVDKTFSL
ncbi:MAG: hypothetical protein IPK55_11180 [Streptococcus sp.]|nr:hypothetical protein [Streptococcus sp.]